MGEATPNPEVHVSESEVLRKMEDEHLRLQRQVRVIQQDRNDAKAGVHPQFRRSDALLSVLKDEYLDLKKDLKIAQSGRHKKNNRLMKREMKKSILSLMKTQHEAEDGVTLMNQLEDLLGRKSKTMLELRKAVMRNVGQINKRREQSEKRLFSTENRLETTQKRFNQVQSENLKIRQEIDHMLKDRLLFNHAWKKMLTVLGKGKKFLTDLFESSTLAYDQRDEWCTKLKSLQEKGRLDQMTQIQEMRDLQKALDNETKLFHFLSVKGVMRVNTSQETKEEAQRIQDEEQRKIDLDRHLKIIDDIVEYTQEENLEKIMQNFHKDECSNFSTYKLLTEVCAENVMLTKEMETVQREISDRHDWNEQQILKEEETIQKLESQLDQISARNEELRQRIAEQDQMVDRTMVQVNEMFKMLNCSLEPYENLLGDEGPSKQRLGLTFSLINEKIKENLEVVYFQEHNKKRPTDRSPGTSRLKTYTIHPECPKFFTPTAINLLVPADTCPACVEARWLSRVSEQDERPLTKKEALAAIAELAEDPSYVRSDRVHTIYDCRAPRSRVILAGRYAQK